MKYYKYINEMEKQAAIKPLKIKTPVQKFKELPMGKKIGAGIGVASTAMTVGGAAVSAGKELVKPIDDSNVKTGFNHGTMQVNPEINKKAGFEHDSLEASKMKYLPIVTGVATAGLIGAGVATGRINKDLLVKEGKRAFKKASRIYDAGSKVVNEASKIAKNKKIDSALKESFEAYKKETGNTLMKFEDFKELNNAYDKWKRATGNSSVSFKDWANKNAKRVLGATKNNGKSNNKVKRTPFIELAKQKAKNGVDAAINGAAFSGAATAANFIGHEIGDEYFRLKDKDETRRRFREDWNNNFADHVVKGKPIKRNYNTGYKTPKQKSKEYKYKSKYIKKVASSPAGDFVNHADDMIGAVNKKLKGKSLVKDIVKNDVVKPAVTGIAYIGAPAAVAAMTKRDRNTMRKIEETKTDKVVLDIPESVMNKKASFKEQVIKNAKKIKTDYVPENLGQEFVRAGIRGVSMAAPVAFIAHKTNRNLRGNMEKLEDKNKALKPVDKGNIRVTVERRIDNE